jgi:hypothetical protein
MANNNRTRKRRKSSSYLLLVLLAIVVFACENNTPKTYTNITGSWRCVESSQFGQRTYLLDIDRKRNSETDFLISNFHNVGYENIFVSFTLNGNKLTLINQNLNMSGYIIKSGNGIVSQDFKEVELNYIIFDGKTDIPFYVVFTR